MTTTPSDPCDLYRNNPAARAVLEERRAAVRHARKIIRHWRYRQQFTRHPDWRGYGGTRVIRRWRGEAWYRLAKLLREWRPV